MPSPNGAVLHAASEAVLDDLLNPRVVEVEGVVDVDRVVAALLHQGRRLLDQR